MRQDLFNQRIAGSFNFSYSKFSYDLFRQQASEKALTKHQRKH